MALLDQIKTASLSARKAWNTAAAASLTTLIGEIETLAKAGKGEMTDAMIVTVIKKFIKNIDETINVAKQAGDPAKVRALWDERELYAQFLPKQLTETELSHLIDSLILTGVKDIGDVMRALKTNHAGQYDGAVASRLLKAKFA